MSRKAAEDTAFRRAFPKDCTFFQTCQQTITVAYETQEVTALAFLSMEEWVPCCAHSGITDISFLLNKDFHSLDLSTWPSKPQYSMSCIITTCSNMQSPYSDSLLNRRNIKKIKEKHITHLRDSIHRKRTDTGKRLCSEQGAAVGLRHSLGFPLKHRVFSLWVTIWNSIKWEVGNECVTVYSRDVEGLLNISIISQLTSKVFACHLLIVWNSPLYFLFPK